MTRKQNPILVTVMAVGMTLGGAVLAIPVANLLGSDIASTTSDAEVTAAPAIAEPFTVTAVPQTTTADTSTTTTQASTTSRTSTSTTRPATTTSPTVEVDVTAQIAVGAAVDQIRLELGLTALATDPTLAAYAEGQAVLMAEAGGLSHGPIESLLNGWVLVGENVGMGDNPADVVAALIASPQHYSIVTEAAYDVDGIGAARDVEGNLWVCQVFAADTLPVTTTTEVPTTVTVPVETTLPEVTLPTVPDTTLPLP